MMMKITINDITDTLKKNGIYQIPATQDEITAAKGLSHNKKLPVEYVRFLEAMGGGTPNGFLVGHSCFIKELKNLREWAEELLVENNSLLKLKPEDFVFWMSQGYQFAFFKIIDDIETSSIYYYSESLHLQSFTKITESLTEFLYRILIKDKFLFGPF